MCHRKDSIRLPITIRWTKDVEAEAKTKAKSNAVRNKLVAKLLHESIQLKAILHRWGLDQGVDEGGASQESKTPKGAGASL